MSNNKIKPSLRKILFCCLAFGALLLSSAWSRPSDLGRKGRFVLKINDTIVKTAYQQMIEITMPSTKKAAW